MSVGIRQNTGRVSDSSGAQDNGSRVAAGEDSVATPSSGTGVDDFKSEIVALADAQKKLGLGSAKQDWQLSPQAKFWGASTEAESEEGGKFTAAKSGEVASVQVGKGGSVLVREGESYSFSTKDDRSGRLVKQNGKLESIENCGGTFVLGFSQPGNGEVKYVSVDTLRTLYQSGTSEDRPV